MTLSSSTTPWITVPKVKCAARWPSWVSHWHHPSALAFLRLRESASCSVLASPLIRFVSFTGGFNVYLSVTDTASLHQDFWFPVGRQHVVRLTFYQINCLADHFIYFACKAVYFNLWPCRALKILRTRTEFLCGVMHCPLGVLLWRLSLPLWGSFEHPRSCFCFCLPVLLVY